MGTDPAKRAFYRVFRDFNLMNDLVNRVETPRSGCFWAGAETDAAMLDYTGNEMTIPFAAK